ncbi:2-C-methyl-D-erythritol 4-phosphate cytidylyltransferase [Mucilaginibacter lappiensis]|uniref:2-C-methyl-D-erythritol 4-phosphate cytidylyltransferase n=1 Tax=Mucilaginibacter lappiensis TaxID=354630 RepID=A0ABR6PK76_9SPHI|nr:2-C-methyl-D-erythritol 4-phosphate cytidylyltransferase [Mucilaginibacter lappiensis]MBB6110172.1 2-C-methyl-D-erythritol 4-phosphate cytidylyltransferase [Mucilaginibacter lappiensis]SIR51001.1 2-C-methyl-D-erythritol 4-phosphate cytidylyltransferase [Mucilaginibacter lappiensis]
MNEQNPTSHISHLISRKNYAIIVAGGTGTRMQSVVPKQFLLLNGLPVLMHTILAFTQSTVKPDIILVLPVAYHDYWEELCHTHQFDTPHALVTGGETRFHSVKNGLDQLLADDNTLVAVHDAVRPLTSSHIIETSYQYAQEHSNAVTAVKSRDSIRQLINDRSVSLLRDQIYMIQTPQTFKADLLKKAYEQPYSEHFTDDASVVEQYGVEIHLTEGSHQNIKLTFPEDIAIAELLLSKKPMD